MLYNTKCIEALVELILHLDVSTLPLYLLLVDVDQSYTIALKGLFRSLPFDPRDFRLRYLAGSSKPRRMYPCGKCQKIYSNASSLYRHLKLECGMLPQFHCPYCRFSSKRKFNLNSHVAHKHLKLLKCYVDKMLSVAVTLSMLKNKMVQALNCVFLAIFGVSLGLEAKVQQRVSGLSEFHLDRRYRVSSSLWKPFPCKRCDRSYKNKSSLNRHVQYECGKEKQFVCPLCQKKFLQKCSLNNHIIAIHRI
ncbi:uncharacterized protein LOC143181431 [Calliopsis andreniformis]|uniref:uncharacterized protein LOC143181431 n=1 Tax=Calliopsis andreniformis TaxID=337506 RepID=UPI003FCEA4C9